MLEKNPRSHICSNALLRVGILYGGNSMMNGADSSENTVDLNVLATIIATIIPKIYNPKVTSV